MDIQTRKIKEVVNEDQSWIGKTHGVEAARSITLDRSAFDLVTDFPDGYIPSGVALGEITTAGNDLYGPYDDTATDGRQTLAGHLLTSIPYDRDAAATSDLGGALFWHGEVVEANLPANHGLDAAGKADVAGKIDYV